MDNNHVQFEPNVPQLVALQYSDGFQVTGARGQPRTMYTLVDGRKMFVDQAVAQSIRLHQFQPGEMFTVTKRVASSGQVRWDVDRMQETGPAVTQAPVMSIPANLPTARHYAPAPAYAQEPRGNGTTGAAPQRQTMPPTKLPANVAFGEIVSFITAELKARGEQWNDEARQAAVCTLFIQAAKEGWLTMWERATCR